MSQITDLKKHELRVALIVVNYNGMAIKFGNKSILRLFFESLYKTSYSNYKTVVVDDKSDDGSLEYIKSMGADAIELKRNINHFSRQNNIGIKYAVKKYDPDYFILLNNDLIFKDKTWLSKMVDVAQKSKAGVIGCNFIPPSAKMPILDSNAAFSNMDHGAPLTACFMISKEAIKKVGVLDEGFLTSWEDIDYCVRTRLNNLPVVRADAVTIVHLEGFSSIKHKNSSRRDWRFYGDRISMVYFLLKKYKKSPYKEKLNTLLIYFGSCILWTYGNTAGKKRKLINFKDRKYWRLKESLKVLFLMTIMRKRITQNDLIKVKET